MTLAWRLIGWGATLIAGSVVIAILLYIVLFIATLAYIGIQAL